MTAPHEHEHRRLSDVRAIIEKAQMSEKAKELALKTFGFVAEAEGKVHGMAPEEVTFHEVGALDSILDICFNCELFTRLNRIASLSVRFRLPTDTFIAPTA